MAISGCTQAQSCSILQNSLAASQLRKLGTFYKVTGHTDHIAVAGVEGQITQIHLERSFDNVQYIFWIPMNSHINRENISRSGGEIFMKFLQHVELVDQLLWFLADRNTGSRCHILILCQANLRVKQKMSIGSLTVFIFMIQIKLFDDLHDLNTQIIGCLVMTKASFEDYPELMEVSDGVMLDIKAFEPEEHKKVTDVTNEMVLKNAVYLAETSKLYEVRAVIVPDLYDTENSVRKIGDFLAPYLKIHDIRVKIIAYRPMGVREEYAHYQIPDQDYLTHLADIMKEKGFEHVTVI